MTHIAFESPEESAEIFRRGMESHPSREAVELGLLHRKEIEQGFLPKVSLIWVHEAVGYGLLLDEPLPKGSFVGEYTGVVRKNDRRYLEPLNNYCYEYPVPDAIGRNYVIDATSGNMTRFINHSFNPNLKPIHVFLDGFYHLIFIALRDLHPGEQLSYDYGRSYWYVREMPLEIDARPSEESKEHDQRSC